MAKDIRIKTDFPDHFKTKKLVKKVGVFGPWALLKIWCYAAANKPSGTFSGFSDQDWLDLLDFGLKKSRQVMEVLVSDGWLDDDGGVLTIHDWKIHNPWVFHSEERAEMARNSVNSRWKKRYEPNTNRIQSVIETNTNNIRLYGDGDGDGDGDGKYLGKCENPLEKNPLSSEPVNPPSESADFQRFMAAYPKKFNEHLAAQAWAQVVESPDIPLIFEALEWQIEMWREGEAKFIPNPANYLLDRRWRDEKPPDAKQERLKRIGSQFKRLVERQAKNGAQSN